jgi:hypothetical protein
MRILPSVLLALAALAAQAGNLARPDQVDLVEPDARTSQAIAMVLLDEDRVDSRFAMNALFRNVNRYPDFVNSGQSKDAVPAESSANRASPLSALACVE